MAGMNPRATAVRVVPRHLHTKPLGIHVVDAAVKITRGTVIADAPIIKNRNISGKAINQFTISQDIDKTKATLSTAEAMKVGKGRSIEVRSAVRRLWWQA